LKQVKELRQLNEKELLEKVAEMKAELRKLKTEIGTGGSVQNPSRVRILRRSIARALTILSEKRRGVSK